MCGGGHAQGDRPRAAAHALRGAEQPIISSFFVPCAHRTVEYLTARVLWEAGREGGERQGVAGGWLDVSDDSVLSLMLVVVMVGVVVVFCRRLRCCFMVECRAA